MTWVRQQQPGHECAPPTTGSIPAIGAAGTIGDLWRCDNCGRLWRVAAADENTRSGQQPHGRHWKPATLWQRLRYAETRTLPSIPREPQPAPKKPPPQIPGPPSKEQP